MKLKLLFLILGTSFISTFGSLYFSEILKFPPCTLCWYQRIFAYPIFILSLVAILKKDYFIFKYIFILSFFGSFVAFYHILYENNLVGHYEVCGVGVDCATKYVEYFGFVTLPVLSFCSFIFIAVLSIFSQIHNKYFKD